jgi:hypothetical protein
MIAVWFAVEMKIAVWLTIFLCSEVELIELIVHEAMIVVLILIFVILIEIESSVTNNL